MKQISFIFTPPETRYAGDELKTTEPPIETKPNVELNNYQFEPNKLGESYVE